MDAPDILNRLHDLGVQVTVSGSKLRLQPVSVIPPDFVQVVKERKSDIMDVLRIQQLKSRYITPSGSTSVDEALEIERRLNETGICLTWCEIVNDFVAFIATEEDAKKVPPGFTIYTGRELFLLFNDAKPDWTPYSLRRIHDFKKAGLAISDAWNLKDDGIST